MNSDFALALHCLLLLANEPDKKITSNEFSKKLNVHAVRVRKTLSLLRKNNYIISIEGVKGGFSINCNPADITLDEIYKLTVSNVLKPKCHECCTSCNIGANIEAVMNEIFDEAAQNLQHFLKGYSLERVINRIRNS